MMSYKSLILMRDLSGLTQVELGKLIGMDQRHYTNTENGRNASHTTISAIKMANYLAYTDQVEDYLEFINRFYQSNTK